MTAVLSVLLFILGAGDSTVPAFDAVRAAWRTSDVVMLDRHGAVLHETRVDRGSRRLEWTRLAEISPALHTAIVAAEDRRFFDHRGVDGRAVADAIWRAVRGAPRRGASTITMQVAAMIDPDLRRGHGPRTLGQKLRQVALARSLETRWSKAEILEAYLNLVTFRGELTGVRAAAAVLFDKTPDGLTVSEAAVIAALVRSPNAGPDLVHRRAAALARDVAPPELKETVDRALTSARGTGPRATLAPHAAMRLMRGRSATATVTTTLDAAMQRSAIAVLRQDLLAVRDRQVHDGAVLVVDNATGDVLAYVGSSGNLSGARWVDGVQARRQPGSALKPFLYGLALDRRIITLATLIEDTPLEISTPLGLYRPQNYDRQFRGAVSARVALASSLNIPAVRVLELLGEDTFTEQLRHLGFDTVREPGDFYGPALALGAADVTLWQLAGAYRAIAEGGMWRPLRLMPATRDVPPGEDGTLPRRVYSAASAFLVADALADRESRSATFGLENVLATPFWTAVKTGTSKDMRDNWCVGFSSRYTVAVWVGNFSGAPMRNVSGVTGAAPIWLELMTLLHEHVPSIPPAPPRAVDERRVLAGPDGPSRPEWFIAGTAPVATRADLPSPSPRIVWPVTGTVVAVDPDIPTSQQAVSFEARGAERVDWKLDGVSLGNGEQRVLWRPRPGKHTLQLVDERGSVRDAVRFEVRGLALPQAVD